MVTVLPEYTDEHLNDIMTDTKCDPGEYERAGLLLRVPAGERQSVEVEVYRRCVVRGAGGIANSVTDFASLRTQVVFEFIFRNNP